MSTGPLNNGKRMRKRGARGGGVWHPDMTLSSTSCRRAWPPLGKCVRKRSCAGGLGDELREVLWHRALDTELLTRVRMGEGEGGGVE